MAAVEITISGLLYDKIARTTQNVTLVGEASLTGLGVGGGPIIPAPMPPGGGLHPEHPIYWPPGTLPHPEHPIALPDPPPDQPPTVPSDPNWEWGWNPRYGWHPVYTPGDKPQPPKPPGK